MTARPQSHQRRTFNDGLARRTQVVATGGSWWTQAPREGFSASAESRFLHRAERASYFESGWIAMKRSRAAHKAKREAESLEALQALEVGVESADESEDES